ncbi:MAG TPA: molybdopterin converting factor subunit 1 [Staphylococcus sp.]|nr:molybdopterin converting factor subunit 1 [Staphylococcus sp.]
MKVLYFAEIKEILAKPSEDIDLSNDITVDEFITYLFEQYPMISDKKFQIAVNEEFVKNDDIVRSNDTVALIPPVSGG